MNRKINVIHIITRLAIGGAQENTILTVSGLDKELFYPIVVSGRERYTEGDLLGEVKRRKLVYFINRHLVRPIQPLKDILFFFSVIKFIQERKGDIVHTHSSKAGIIGRFAAFVAGSRIIIHTAHGWSFHERMRKLVKLIYILLERLAAKISHRIICVTNQDVKKGLQKGIGEIDKYVIIRSGFEIALFKKQMNNAINMKKKLGLPLRKKIVGTVGRFSYQKDPVTFVRIAHRVNQTRKDVIFIIVGDGDLRPQIEELIEKLKLGETVFLLGVRKQVEEIFPIFDVFLLTSLWEGLPKVIPQAMASGVPVVSTAVDGVKEVVKHNENGLLSMPKDVESLAKNVIRLLDDGNLRKRFVSNSFPIVKQFDSALMVKQIERLYIELIRGH